ncbi:MAG: 1-acyl-sn-glycerol-3-phosphate acyltransferase [bacterium]
MAIDRFFYKKDGKELSRLGKVLTEPVEFSHAGPEWQEIVGKRRLIKPARKLLQQALNFLLRGLKITGKENIEKNSTTGRLIIAPHMSNLDFPAIKKALKTKPYAIAGIAALSEESHQSIFTLSMFEDTSLLLPTIPPQNLADFKDRELKRKLLENTRTTIIEALCSGHDVVLFPAGTRANNEEELPGNYDKAKRFTADIANEVITRTGALTILAVSIYGTQQRMPRNNKFGLWQALLNRNSPKLEIAQPYDVTRNDTDKIIPNAWLTHKETIEKMKEQSPQNHSNTPTSSI